MRKVERELTEIVRIMKGGVNLLPGTLSRVKQKRHREGCEICRKGGHGPYWYLTWKEGKRSRALYIPPQYIEQVREGVENMKKLKEYINKLASKRLKELEEERDVRKRR